MLSTWKATPKELVEWEDFKKRFYIDIGYEELISAISIPLHLKGIKELP